MQARIGQHALEGMPNFTRANVNLLDEAAVKDVFSEMGADGHRFTTVVCTVGGFAMGSLQDTDKAMLDKMLGLNLYSAFFTAKAAIAHMRAYHLTGHIFLVASKQGLEPAMGKSTVAYTLSKAGIVALADILNAEAAKEHIITSIVVPSIIDTPINREAMPDAEFDKWVEPEQIAEAVYFYSTSKAGALRAPILKVFGDS